MNFKVEAPNKNHLPARWTGFAGVESDDPNEVIDNSKFVETWQDEDGNIQIRVIDNQDALTTRITISGAGVEMLWHPGDSDDDHSCVVVDNRERFKRTA